jgi:hypothetical protein
LKKNSNFTRIHLKIPEFHEEHLIYHKSAKHSKLTKTTSNFTTPLLTPHFHKEDPILKKTKPIVKKGVPFTH